MKGTMKALVKDKPGPGAVLKTVDIPQVGPQEVLVKPRATSICGTDLHIYNWDNWAQKRLKPPFIIGHEVAGDIVELGSEVRGWEIGDYVSVECHKVCGVCYHCRTGQAHICSNYTILGVDFNGVFAEYVSVPVTNLWRNKPSLTPEVASLQDPIGNAVLTTLSHDVTTKTVLVMGCGAIGIFCVGIASAAGAEQVIAIDVNDYRLNMAAKLGATSIINARQLNVIEEVRRLTDGEGVDIMLEMSGNEKAFHDALSTVKNGGRVSLLSVYPDKVTMDLAEEVVFKGLTILGITGREIWNTWYKTAGLLNSGKLDVNPVITHKFPLEEFEEGFRLMNAGLSGKVILYPHMPK